MNILIVRLSAIGDVVMAYGLINSLKKRYPGCHLTWLCEPAAAALLKENPALDELVIWSKSEWLTLLKKGNLISLQATAKTLLKQLRSRRYDLAIDAQGLMKSSIWGFLAGAKRRVGYKTKEPTYIFNNELISIRRNDLSISSEYKEIATYLNCSLDDFDAAIRYSETTRENTNNLLPKSLHNNSYVVIAPFTTRPQKHWPEAHWQSLIQRLLNNRQQSIVILGGPTDKLAAEQLQGKNPELINLVGKTSLLEATAIIDKARLVIGVDTGLTHIGVGMGINTIALFGSTRPYLNTDNANARILYKELACSPCRRNPTCNGEFTCMSAITPAQVIETAAELAS